MFVDAWSTRVQSDGGLLVSVLKTSEGWRLAPRPRLRREGLGIWGF